MRDNMPMELEHISTTGSYSHCPACSYIRKANESAPAWQCPQCGIAYAKVHGVVAQQSASPRKPRTFSYGRDQHAGKSIHRLLNLLFLLSCSLWVLALTNKGNFPETTEIHQALLQDPLQSVTSTKPFLFNYRGTGYEVAPMADYELWGLVVTHNDIEGLMDLTHDENSVDIRDICVVWGNNLRTDDYKQVRYSSGDFVCYFQYGPGVSFDHDRLSNSHLLADDAAVRQMILNTRVGDQIHLKGMLVNYRPVDQSLYWRNSSLTRKDSGNGACEVVFVEAYDILKAGTPFWYQFYTWMAFLMPVLLLVKFSLFVHDTIGRK